MECGDCLARNKDVCGDYELRIIRNMPGKTGALLPPLIWLHLHCEYHSVWYIISNAQKA